MPKAVLSWTLSDPSMDISTDVDRIIVRTIPCEISDNMRSFFIDIYMPRHGWRSVKLPVKIYECFPIVLQSSDPRIVIFGGLSQSGTVKLSLVSEVRKHVLDFKLEPRSLMKSVFSFHIVSTAVKMKRVLGIQYMGFSLSAIKSTFLAFCSIIKNGRRRRRL